MCRFARISASIAHSTRHQRIRTSSSGSFRPYFRELSIAATGIKPGTIFFGGGTPSLLGVPQWQEIFTAIEKLGMKGAAEVTIECNPATVSVDKAAVWRAHGVNRISLGVQSFSPRLLKLLGRIHTRKMVFQTYDLLRETGFQNINLDLMFAIPGQTLENWRETLREARALAPEHLSSYELTYEEDTPFFRQLQAGKIDRDEELACAMYEELLEHTAATGLVQYEVSNFARDIQTGHEEDYPTFACRHNVNYWRGGNYVGLGPSAASYMGKVRTQNWANTELYCSMLEKGQRPVESRDELSPVQRAGEILAFGLRMNAGWPLAQFRAVTGFDLLQEWKVEVAQALEKGWGQVEPERFRLTTQGMRFADAAAELFLR